MYKGWEEYLIDIGLKNIADALSIQKIKLTDNKITVYFNASAPLSQEHEQGVLACVQSEFQNAAIVIEQTQGTKAPVLTPEAAVATSSTSKNKLKPKSALPKQPAAKTSILYGVPFKRLNILSISEIIEATGKFCITGKLIKIAERETYDKVKNILSLNITDYKSTITCKLVLPIAQAKKLLTKLKEGMGVRVCATAITDKYLQEVVGDIASIESIEIKERTDNAPVKRVELHLHTKMSMLDGFTDIAAVVSRAAAWGHESIAVTDHGVVQAFPDFYNTAKKANVQHIFGMEGYLLDDSLPLRHSGKTYVVFDIETTGLDSRYDHITEIGALKYIDGELLGEFSTLVNPGVVIPNKIIEISGITNEMVKDAPAEKQAVADFFGFHTRRSFRRGA